MRITFLGTGTSQGVPVIGCECKVCKSENIKDKRLRSSVLIEENNKNIIIDTGPDLRQQSLKNNICKIDFVLYTHAHRDHVSGIDELRSFNFIQKEEIHGFGNKELVKQLKNDYSYIFQNQNYPKQYKNYLLRVLPINPPRSFAFYQVILATSFSCMHGI